MIICCRDFWSDEGVKDMVWCSFVFWQKMDITPDGETYIAYYKVNLWLHCKHILQSFSILFLCVLHCWLSIKLLVPITTSMAIR